MRIEGTMQASKVGRQLTVLLIYDTYEAAHNTYKQPVYYDSSNVQ